MEIKVTSTINQAPDDESYGFREITITPSICTANCSGCSNSATNCTGCNTGYLSGQN